MRGSVEIDIDTLRAAVVRLLDHVKETNGTVLHLGVDYFWSISSVERYDPTQEPSALTIGQVSESFGWLRRLEEPDPPVISAGLTWAADVFAAIAAEASP